MANTATRRLTFTINPVSRIINWGRKYVAPVVPPAPDTTAPIVTAFVIPSTATSLTVAISSFTATDAVGVTGYKITETNTPPLAGATGWTATAPTSYTFTTEGAKTLYAWAKDAAGNVSAAVSDSVTISLPVADTTAPTVTAFVIPSTATSLTVAISTFTATDNVAVTGYKITESATPPLPGATGWTATAPTSYTFTDEGSKTLYAWAKDAAGNVSAAVSDSVYVTLPVIDTTAPVVTSFTIPATADGLTVAISTFTATDNVAVTGYKITESATPPLAGATGWTATAPASYTFSNEGTKTLYAWAKDAAGNVSASLNDSVVISSGGELIFRSGFESTTAITTTAAPEYYDITGTDASVAAPNSWGSAGLEKPPHITSARVLVGVESDPVQIPEIVNDPQNASNKVLLFKGVYPNDNLDGGYWGRKFRMQADMFSSQGGFSILYYKIKMLMPLDFEVMQNRSETITWFTIAEFWNESSGANMFRISLTVAKLNTGTSPLNFRVTTEKYNGTAFESVFTKNNTSFEVPIDTWLELEVNIVEGNNSTGKIYLAVTPAGDSKQIIFNETTYTHHPNLVPNGITYFSPFKLYTYGYLADAFRDAGKIMQLYYDDFEIWADKVVI